MPTNVTISSPPVGDELTEIDLYWRAANFLSLGQIYLLDNPLLRAPLLPQHVKPRLLGHWGTTPGLNFIYAHLNRQIRMRDANVLFVCGPGHGGPGIVANTYLEGTYTETYPDVTLDEVGLQKLFRQFSFPGGIPSHASPETPGSIHEGGELGYSLAHAFGAAFDNPDLIVACVVGDGEAETGPLAGAWHSNKFLNPATDGAVLPILHLNGYKIANPTLLARMPGDDLRSLFVGYGYDPIFVEGDDPPIMHRLMADALDRAFDAISDIQTSARRDPFKGPPPRWPLIVLRSPKGWTGPQVVDGLKVEGFWRAHQVPIGAIRDNPAHLTQLEEWLRSYRPDEIFDESGRPRPTILALAPQGARRMGANPHANGGALRRPLNLPDWRNYGVPQVVHGRSMGEATRLAGAYLRDVLRASSERRDFRLFGPDETASNRLDAVFEATDRVWIGERLAEDVHLSPDGRVMEVLSEHLCQGWLEGYVLTGRHGLFSCYEAFIHIVDSMFNQHAKWLEVARRLPWRKPVSSLNYLLTSHVWRQDHNGFSHQDPGFVDLVMNKKADIVRVYMAPDANCLLWIVDHCLRTYDRINVIVAGKQPAPQWFTVEEAAAHCEAGAGILPFASNDEGGDPDVVLACAGDVPTLETVAAAGILRTQLPSLKVRVVNVLDLMTLQPRKEHPHGMADETFEALFTMTKPVIFAYHGYPYLIHRLTYARTSHGNMHVRGFREEGTTTTPFDMTVLNGLDRYHLVLDVLDHVTVAGDARARLAQIMRDKLAEHSSHIRRYGEDLPEIRDWAWPG
ncbi:MAG: phosphoketolase family protein [Alsobacter sp.]